MVEAILMTHSEMDAGPAIASSTKKGCDKSRLEQKPWTKTRKMANDHLRAFGKGRLF